MTIEIPLTRGQVAIVDDIDGDLASFNWYAGRRGKLLKFVARRTISTIKGKKITGLMHRDILSRMLDRPLLPSEQVDHKDLNTLNNRRENLRLATGGQNQRNKGRLRSNTSGFKGVYFCKRDNKWRATIHKDSKRFCLGSFNTPEEAHDAYCKAAKELHGEFARPGDTDRTQAAALIAKYGTAATRLTPYSNNKSGCRGVIWDKSKTKWRATIYVNKKRIYLGLFPTVEEGRDAYLKAYAELVDNSRQ